MEIDIYQTCPCHSEKKIKFCCGKDIVGDLNRVLELNERKQSVAALEHLDRTIRKLGPRDCLQTIKTHLLINLHEYHKANEINQAFLETHPNHPIGHQHRALLLASESRPDDAIQALQDAIDASPADEIPVSMANAFRIVGLLLLAHGGVVAGRAHLIFASGLRKDSDESINDLIMQTYRSPHLPMLLKHDFNTLAVDDDVEWKSTYDNARRYAMRARWRAALLRSEKLLEKYPDEPALLRASAIWSTYLNEADHAAKSWRRLSELGNVDFEDAVEARLMSLLLSDQQLSEALDIVKIAYPITDLESLKEQATASPRLVPGSGISQQTIDPDSPPPVAGYLLLDRDEVKSISDHDDDDDFPQIIGELLIYGTQTDRAARLEFVTIRDIEFEKTREQLQEILGEWMQAPDAPEVVGEVSASEHQLTHRWHLPTDATIDQQRDWIGRQRHHTMLKEWPNIPYSVLDGQTPRVASGDPGKKVTVAALVTMMEQGADSQLNNQFDFNMLRQELGIDETPVIDPHGLDPLSLSPIQQQRLNFEKLGDEDLVKLYVSASTIGNLEVLRKSSPVILSREQLKEVLHFEMVYASLAKITPDNDQALECMQQARHYAKAAGRPLGHLLVDELEIRMERGMTESCPELLRVIQTSHADDPQVQYHLASVLTRFGIIGPDGRPVAPPADAAPAPTATESSIWTPDASAGASPSPAAEEESKSQLWIPE